VLFEAARNIYAELRGGQFANFTSNFPPQTLSGTCLFYSYDVCRLLRWGFTLCTFFTTLFRSHFIDFGVRKGLTLYYAVDIKVALYHKKSQKMKERPNQLEAELDEVKNRWKKGIYHIRGVGPFTRPKGHCGPVTGFQTYVSLPIIRYSLQPREFDFA
jgi:hypothetical protein